MSQYQRRVIDNDLDLLLPELAAMALEGAKGVGKTATARARANTVHLLDDARVLQVVEADPSRLLDGPYPVLIDEWQRSPGSWDQVRRAVDDDATPGRFLLTGSASPAGVTTHSGAARIVQLRMRPLALSERGMKSSVSLAELLSGSKPTISGATTVSLEDYVSEILASGFPALRGLGERALRLHLDSYLARVVDRDFPEMGHPVRRPDALRRWMAAYAAASSTTASYDTIRDAATGGEGDKPAKTTTGPYRDILERLWLVDPLPAWSSSRNHLNRLGAAPKHQLADPALAARLLDVGADDLLDGREVGPAVPRDGTLLGALFESLVAQSLRTYAQSAEAKVGHLRTQGGSHEVDFIVTGPGRTCVAIEVKLSAVVTDHDVRHLHWLGQQLGAELSDSVIVTTGRDAYRRKDGVAVVPAALLGP